MSRHIGSPAMTHNGKWSVAWLCREYALDKRQARRLRRKLAPVNEVYGRAHTRAVLSNDQSYQVTEETP